MTLLLKLSTFTILYIELLISVVLVNGRFDKQMDRIYGSNNNKLNYEVLKRKCET